MKAIYVSDPVKGPGFGLLRISDASGVLVAGSLRCRITRVADDMSLSREGWSQTLENLPLRGGARKGNGFFFSVGPEVTDNLDAMGEYNLTLACADGSELVAPLEFEQAEYPQNPADEREQVPSVQTEAPEMVTKSADASFPDRAAQGGTVSGGAAPGASFYDPAIMGVASPGFSPAASTGMPVRPSPETVRFAEVPTLAYPAANFGAEGGDTDLALMAASRDTGALGERDYGARGGYFASETAPVTEARPPKDTRPETYLPTEQKREWTGKILPVLVVLLLFLGGGFAIWTILSLTDDGEAGRQVPPLRAEVKVEAEADPASKPETAARTENASEAGSPLQRARAHLSGRADALISLAMAKEFRPMSQGADAAFLLAEDAAQKGLPEAMLIAGSFYDPVDISPCGTIIKDPFEALNWYSKAAGAGIAGALGRISALKSLLQMQSANGNSEAKSLLKKF